MASLGTSLSKCGEQSRNRSCTTNDLRTWLFYQVNTRCDHCQFLRIYLTRGIKLLKNMVSTEAIVFCRKNVFLSHCDRSPPGQSSGCLSLWPEQPQSFLRSRSVLYFTDTMLLPKSIHG